jgi:hypothetical protein
MVGCSARGAKLPDSAVVLNGKLATQLLHQCSRQAPRAGESTWQPGAAEIVQLETALPKALKSAQARKDFYWTRINPHYFQIGLEWSKAPEGWRRQYVGLLRGGRRFVYGNFFRSDLGENLWRTQPVIACDGGPSFFGAEYDVEAQQFTHIDFNDAI